jgi:hypothetical protein
MPVPQQVGRWLGDLLGGLGGLGGLVVVSGGGGGGR